ncbi:ABC transporter ATP-binding protein [Nesterenkonia sp. CL21]|uniref:ABC transporter ATP-binding protein n=1 Tax=Nesterenkonia sp. CL21 TaxID=3064894 RepID=UPI00287B0B9F|nr:ABC transporter ATP-binding protein [Nesterenkonia sp. CL21]MDS2172020.1 ABC transporter ATP-binding protein [Nesterenkonia sp. CL21]
MTTPALTTSPAGAPIDAAGQTAVLGAGAERPGLQVVGASVGFGRGTPILQGVDLEVAPGSTTAIVGPSGSGKTSLLRVIAGFLRPATGTVSLRGQEVTQVPAHRRSIGLVAQDGALFPHLDVAGNIAFGLPKGIRRGEARRRVEELLDLVSLDRSHARRRPDQLSGGQRQRVALARALARRPEVILLDEPFSALDAGLREITRQAVREILASTGTTTVLVTHDQDEALSFADQVAVLRDGRLAQTGTPEEIYRRPRDARTARFLGEAVLLPARLRSPGVASTVLGDVSVVRSEPEESAEDRSWRTADASATVMLRPEQIVLADEGVRAEVLTSQYFGHDTTAVVSVDGLEEPIRVRRLNADPLPPGAVVRLAVAGPGVAYPESEPQH